MNSLSSAPLIIAHGPPAEAVLFLLLLPMLLFGAVLPATLYLRLHPSRSRGRKALRLTLAAVLNLYGFWGYVIAAWYVSAMVFHDSGALVYGIIALAICLFGVVEIATLNNRRRILERRRQDTLPPTP